MYLFANVVPGLISGKGAFILKNTVIIVSAAA
jgi:hypothetical protein